MTTGESYLAFDLGAESGRAVLGTLTDGYLRMEEIHRFANGPIQVGDSLYWDPLYLWQEIQRALALAATRAGNLAGIGLDTWGVDFTLLDRRGELLGLPHHYRDPRTAGILDELRRDIAPFDLYQQVGAPGMAISTLCQMLALRRQNSPLLAAAARLLLMPDLFNYWLCGRLATEATIAGSTQFYNLGSGDWHRPLLAGLGLPAGLPGEIVRTGTVLGPLLPTVARQAGLGPVPVIVPACHDTPCAMAAVPAAGADFTAISSGTWSVVGAELETPLLTRAAMELGFINEVGAGGKILLAVNSSGLWPLQECQREWRQQGHEWSYAELAARGAAATPLTTIVDPDAPELALPGDMSGRLRAYYLRTAQRPPAEPGEMVRALLEGLALRYRKAIGDLDRLTGRCTGTIHIIGGGARNALLCQLTADATGIPVLAGPAEATASGNLLLQALARGHLGSLAEVRAVVARSCKPVLHEPRPGAVWDDAYVRFLRLCAAGAH